MAILSGFWRAMSASEGKLSYREVMLKLSWAMLCHVEAICQILLGHAPFKGQVYGYLKATLVPSCGQLQRFCGCVEGYMR